MLANAAWRTLQILFFRAGPQDFPYSPQLTRATALICMLMTTVLLQLFVPLAIALTVSVSSIAVLASLSQTLLNLRKLPNRFDQTFGALTSAGIAFCILMLPIMIQTAPSFLKIINDPALLERVRAGDSDQFQLPVAIALGWDIVFFWSVAVFANIFRQAADFSVAAGVLTVMVLVFMQMIVSSFTAAVVRTAIS